MLPSVLVNMDFAASSGVTAITGNASHFAGGEPVWTKRWRGGSNGLNWIRRDEWKQKSSSPSPA